jgi:hypothetical protein
MKIWIDNDEMKMPCGVCGEPHLEQLIQHEDARLGGMGIEERGMSRLRRMDRLLEIREVRGMPTG